MSIYVPARPAKAALPALPAVIPERHDLPMKAMTGLGAALLNSELPLSILTGRNNPQKKMRRAWELGISVPWIRKAEQVITFAFSTVLWHLEDAQDEAIDDKYPGMQVQRARALIEKPGALLPSEAGKRITRRELWALTCRHMGLCGNAFWYLDQPELAARTPAAIKYLRPDRMTPKEDTAGNLQAWYIDRTDQSPGIEVSLEQILQFVLEPPDSGHFGIGLVESALLKAQNSVAIDQHLAYVLSSGGRMAGILAPKGQGEYFNAETYPQIVNDARMVAEAPDAARRMHVLRGPVEFTPTVDSNLMAQMVELLTQTRDDLLGLWGVPLSQIASTGAGLNSGDKPLNEFEAFWKNAVHPRLVAFRETLQFGLLDRWADLGAVVELELEEPEFDDDAPLFAKAEQAMRLPLRVREVREIVRLEPFGPDVRDEQGRVIDDIVLGTMTTQPLFYASEIAQSAPSAAVVAPASAATTSASAAAGETMAGKASLRGIAPVLARVRSSADERLRPRLRVAVGKVLADQRDEIAQRAAAAAEHLLTRPGDTSAWWDGAKWDRRLREALAPGLVSVAEELDAHIRGVLAPRKAVAATPLRAVQRTLERGGTRISGLNQRTRDAVLRTVRDVVAEGLERGDPPATVGVALREAIGATALENGLPAWGELRAETVARTEMMTALNDATLASYEDMGVTQVEAIDGDFDEVCAERNGQVFTLDEAAAVDEHPNGTLDWIPIIGEETA